jgi:hypothetical protein
VIEVDMLEVLLLLLLLFVCERAATQSRTDNEQKSHMKTNIASQE